MFTLILVAVQKGSSETGIAKRCVPAEIAERSSTLHATHARLPVTEAEPPLARNDLGKRL